MATVNAENPTIIVILVVSKIRESVLILDKGVSILICALPFYRFHVKSHQKINGYL